LENIFMPTKVIVTTDPGQDEAAAIMMMLAAPESFDILGFVATAGNIGLDHTVINMLKILELAARADIPVFAGCPRPILKELVIADHVHGPTGLDGHELPTPTTRVQKQHGVEFIVETLRSAPPGEVHIVSLSPTTNLALALVQAPDIAARIGGIVMMAGAYFECGNITPSAEFNVRRADHHAAARRDPQDAQHAGAAQPHTRCGHEVRHRHRRHADLF
jgi:purine nucleosidase